MDYPVKCWVCSQKSGTIVSFPIGTFEEHNSDLHGMYLYTCKLCPNKFTCPEDMKAHHKEDHAKHPCLECHRRYGLNYFFDEEGLKRHFGKEHSTAKCKCKYCPSLFVLPRTRNKHMFYWHGHELVPEKIKCVNCHYSGISLDDHNKSKHREMKYKCNDCSNVFKTNDLKSRHKCDLSDSED